MRKAAHGILVMLVLNNASVLAQSQTQTNTRTGGSAAPRSFVEGIQGDRRNRLGLSLSVDEIYVPTKDIGQNRSSDFTTVYPTAFTNLHGREWYLSLNYSFGYSRYRGTS